MGGIGKVDNIAGRRKRWSLSTLPTSSSTFNDINVWYTSDHALFPLHESLPGSDTSSHTSMPEDPQKSMCPIKLRRLTI